MAKYIKVTDDIRENIIKEFIEKVGGLKSANGKLTYTKEIGTNDRKALLLFTELAYTKVTTLVNNWTDEIAWHCLARRGENPDEYVIYDVLIYPQEVTGTTVTTDQEKYQTWLYEQPDEVFNNIRCQSHSHVNMGVSPSAVDDKLYEEILSQLTDDMFYIFTIHNKKGDIWVAIYDLEKNLLFTGKDVQWNIIEDGTGILDLIDDAKEKVKKHTYTTTYNYAGVKSPVTNPPATTTKDGGKGVPKKNTKKGNTAGGNYDYYGNGYGNYYGNGYYY